ncbi:MAG: AI-2E family transporter [Gammaproteobacteria bacterium]
MDGGWTAHSLTKTPAVIEQKRIEDIVGLSALALVVAGCLLVLAPFLSALLWAVVITFSTWGIYQRVGRLIGGRYRLAAVLMTVALAAVLVGPFAVVGAHLGENADALARAVRRMFEEGPPALPDWVTGLPLIGAKLDALWHELAADQDRFLTRMREVAAPVAKWLLTAGLAFGTGLLHLSLSVLAAYLLYRHGAAIAVALGAGMEHIAGHRARHLLDVIGSTVKGVVYGVIGTVLAQGILAGFGFWLAGVPGPFLLGLLTCFLTLVPLAPVLLWVPSGLWLYHQGETGWAIFIVLWMNAVGAIDIFVKPYIISQGSALPFLLVLLGVLGGVAAFGITGFFLGPTLLAIGYALLREWTHTGEPGPQTMG